jgi:hypothetical protein
MSSNLEQFNLEQMWLKYLNLVGLKLHDMHPDQLRETKQAFVAGVGQAIVLLTQELPELHDDVALHVTDQLMLQVANYFTQ